MSVIVFVFGWVCGEFFEMFCIVCYYCDVVVILDEMFDECCVGVWIDVGDEIDFVYVVGFC